MIVPMDTRQLIRPVGGRGVPRPDRIETCSTCGEQLGWSYPDCQNCREAVDRIWRADWEALLEAEEIVPGSEDEALLARVALAESERHPWTIVDIAMSLVRCDACGAELGGGPAACAECAFAFGNLWAYDIEAGGQGTMTRDEHALRVGRWVLRYPHRYNEAVVFGWRLAMPRLLTGALPTTRQAQALRARINAGWRGRLDLNGEPI